MVSPFTNTESTNGLFCSAHAFASRSGEPTLAGWPDRIDLTALRDIVDGPLRDIAARFSGFLAADWPHQALIIFTRECTGRPRTVAEAGGITG